MSIAQFVFSSITNPKKLAAFRFITIGKVIQYVFLFVTILSLISFLGFIGVLKDDASSTPGILEFIHQIEWLLYPFAFIIQFIMSTLMLFTRISLMAMVGFLLLKLLNRRGDYRHVWRTTAFAYTTPTILSIAFIYIGMTEGWNFIISSIICFIYLGLALKYYPKK